jgi:hypothetical protein
MLNSEFQCGGGNGCWGRAYTYTNQDLVNRAAVTASTLSAFGAYGPGAYAGPYGNISSAAVAGPAGVYSPPVQLRLFDPAFKSPLVHYAALPYAPSLVSVASPVRYASGAGAAAAAVGADLAVQGGVGAAVAAGTLANAVIPGASANPCGSCTAAFSQLPPTGYEAWRGLIERNNLPYQDLFGAGYLQGVGARRF